MADVIVQTSWQVHAQGPEGFNLGQIQQYIGELVTAGVYLDTPIVASVSSSGRVQALFCAVTQRPEPGSLRLNEQLDQEWDD